MAEPASGSAETGVSRDAWLGGRLTLVQPRRGHRAGTDAALLAAAADFSEGRFVDVGAGVGAVALAILTRCARASADLVEIDAGLAAQAEDNANATDWPDVRDLSPRCLRRPRPTGGGSRRRTAEAVVTNPPFFDPGTVCVSPDPARARAYVFGGEAGAAPLVAWIRACLAILKPGGRFVMIHRPDALTAILDAAENRLGALALLPVHPRAGVSAQRLLVSGVKGSKAPLRIAPGLVLHGADGRMTAQADAIHRGEALIDWGA